MSHFSVAVFTKEKPNCQIIEEMLDPFWEGDGSQDENTPGFQFVDETEDYREDYEESASKELYPTFEDFMLEGYGMKPNENGKYGGYANPNAKWDWYSIGGRWGDMLKTKDGGADSARVSEVDFVGMKAEKLQGLTPYEEYIKSGFFKEEYLREMYPTEDEYKERASSFTTYAVITPDGIWMAPGEMGWFGCSSETADESRSWDSNYHKFLEEYSDCWITIVDCHI